MNDTLEVTKTNIAPARTRVSIQAAADANGKRKAPTRLQLVKSGAWVNSWKGDLEITVSDLDEMKVNFDNGVGLPDKGSEGAQIDYRHEDYSVAAGWIKAVEVIDGILYASEIEWTPKARQAIEDGEWKFFSPSFYPACLGQWYDPEDPTITARNVLMGGGLTNIPFFKGLSGLKASQGSGNVDQIYISADSKGENMSDVATITAKDKATLTDEDKAFLNEHKDELTADQLVEYGIDQPAATPPAGEEGTPAPAADAPAATAEDVTPVEAAAIKASLEAGTHKLVASADLAAMQASIQASATQLKAMNREKIDKEVLTHVERGAIKADQATKWGDLIEADAKNADLLKGLNDNPVLAAEVGKDNGSATSAVESLTAKINAAVSESDGKLSYSDAVTKIRKEDPALAKAYDDEIKGE